MPFCHRIQCKATEMDHLVVSDSVPPPLFSFWEVGTWEFYDSQSGNWCLSSTQVIAEVMPDEGGGTGNTWLHVLERPSPNFLSPLSRFHCTCQPGVSGSRTWTRERPRNRGRQGPAIACSLARRLASGLTMALRCEPIQAPTLLELGSAHSRTERFRQMAIPLASMTDSQMTGKMH